MPHATVVPKPTWIGIVSFFSVACLMGAACGGGGGDPSATTGGVGGMSGGTGPGKDPAGRSRMPELRATQGAIAEKQLAVLRQ